MKPSTRRNKRIKAALKPRLTRQVVPYDTGKVQIGLLYQPPPPKMDADDERIQAALMHWPLSIERRVADWIERSPWSLVGAAGLIIFAISFMKGCTR